MAVPLSNYHDVISCYNHILNITKTLVQLTLKNITSYCHTKWNQCVSEPSKLSIEGCKKWGSPITLMVSVSLFTITNSHHAGIHKQMSNVLWSLKWYGFLMIPLLRLVTSKQNLSFRLPDLSLPSTSTKKLIQGVHGLVSVPLLVTFYLLLVWKLLLGGQELGDKGFALVLH